MEPLVVQVVALWIMVAGVGYMLGGKSAATKVVVVPLKLAVRAALAILGYACKFADEQIRELCGIKKPKKSKRARA